MSYLAEKKAETHTIAVFTGVWLTNPLTSAEAQVTFKDLTPIARLVLEPALIVVKADAPYKSLKDFIDDAKKNPGQLKQSGGTPTGRDNVVRQLLQKHTGAQWAFVSFPGGGERIAALLGGHVNMMVIEPQEAGEHIRSGNMRVLAQVSNSRLALSQVPTMKEAGFDVPSCAGSRRGRAPWIPAAGSPTGEFFREVVQPLRGRSTSRSISSRTAFRKARSLRSFPRNSRTVFARS